MFDDNEYDIDSLYIRIGKNVKKYREEAKMTQLELSQKMGYKSVSLVSAAELYTKEKHFNIKHLHILSIIFKVDICEFFK